MWRMHGWHVHGLSYELLTTRSTTPKKFSPDSLHNANLLEHSRMWQHL